MLKLLLAAAAILLPFQATAQQIATPVPECLTVTPPGPKRILGNKCERAINVQIFDAGKKELVERELKPKEEVPVGTEIFGSACPAGYRSNVAVSLANRPLFRKDDYKCLPK